MAAKPVILKVRDAALAAKAAYDEGRLSAQGPKPACRYRDRAGRPCAVGAAIPDRTAAMFDEQINSAVDDLIGGRLLTTDLPQQLRCIQTAHDEWVRTTNRAWTCNQDIEAAERAFVATLTSILNTAEPS